MSTQSKLYEGPALEPLIERIHKELGPDAKILSADRVRQGGVAGFFARQVFRLTVEVKQPSREGANGKRPASKAAQAGGAPSVKAARTPELVGVGASSNGTKSSGTKSNGTKSNGTKSPAVAGPAPAASSLPTATASVDTTATADELIGQALSAAVLRATLGEEPANPMAALADSTTDVIELVSPLPSTETEPFARVLEQVAHAMETTSPLAAGPAPAPAGVIPGPLATVTDIPAAPAPAPQPAPTAEEFSSTEEMLAKLALPQAPVAAASTPGASALAGAGPVDTGSAAPTRLEPSQLRALQRTGLPAAMVGEVDQKVAAGAELRLSLIETLRALPEAPPLPWRIGSLIAVVGEGGEAEALCCQLAQELGLDIIGDVAYATPDAQARKHCAAATLARTAGEAAERAPGWRRSAVALVAVDAPVTGRQRAWANNVLMAMRPTSVWGLVDSQCKTEDVKAWADDLGGMDALAVTGVQNTVSPAAVLDTGIPVAFVDGTRSSAERWAAVIADRVAPCE